MHGTFSRGHTGRVTADVSNAARADADLDRGPTGGAVATLNVGGH